MNTKLERQFTYKIYKCNYYELIVIVTPIVNEAFHDDYLLEEKWDGEVEKEMFI